MILDWFDLSLSLLEWILLATLFLAFLVQLFFYLHHYRGVVRKVNRIGKGKEVVGTAQPPVSIIICARNKAKSLENNLPAILEQDYPEFQVVVVNDASSDDTENILIRLEQKYTNLYHTFIPSRVQSVSAKKMAMNLGIKAAKYDTLLFTEADCLPVTNQWVSSMMRNFDSTCGLVLGYSSFKRLRGFLKLMIPFDTLMTALQFMGAAERGKPYKAFGSNMAYRKDLFFNNRGFASHLNLRAGEDDLFISEVATSKNTRIEISPESKICMNSPQAWRYWKELKMNHLSTFPYYKAGARFRTGMELASRFLFYGLFVTLLVIGIASFNIPMIAYAGVLFLIRYFLQLSVVNKAAKSFGEPRYYLSLPIFDILLPLFALWFSINQSFHKDSSYTWQVLH